MEINDLVDREELVKYRVEAFKTAIKYDKFPEAMKYYTKIEAYLTSELRIINHIATEHQVYVMATKALMNYTHKLDAMFEGYLVN